ncbi:hypothetical protein ABEB36_002027 [Hypothenemus hampei]|uniref:Uncharacterized protein n=1 Tax=Hypothenemus hampei TaxID=57062 RepID=A0ABD1F4B9_HYPHA
MAENNYAIVENEESEEENINEDIANNKNVEIVLADLEDMEENPEYEFAIVEDKSEEVVHADMKMEVEEIEEEENVKLTVPKEAVEKIGKTFQKVARNLMQKQRAVTAFSSAATSPAMSSKEKKLSENMQEVVQADTSNADVKHLDGDRANSFSLSV